MVNRQISLLFDSVIEMMEKTNLKKKLNKTNCQYSAKNIPTFDVLLTISL